MTKTLLSGVAAFAFAISAPSVFAQDAKMETKTEAKVKTDAMMDKAEDMAEDAMDATDSAAEETMDDAEDMMGDAEDMADMKDEMDADMDAKADMKMKAKAEMKTTVGCPEGTEAQGDGTCMVTGEWDPEG